MRGSSWYLSNMQVKYLMLEINEYTISINTASAKTHFRLIWLIRLIQLISLISLIIRVSLLIQTISE